MKPILLESTNELQKGDKLYLRDNFYAFHFLNPTPMGDDRISYEFPHGGVGAIDVADALILRQNHKGLQVLLGERAYNTYNHSSNVPSRTGAGSDVADLRVLLRPSR